SETLGVSVITASGNVRVDVDEPAAHMIGHRLIVDAAANQAEVFGSTNEPARIVRNDGTLKARHIVMNQQAQTFHVVGPGSITMLTHDQKAAPADDKPAAKRPRPDVMNITWQKAMHFDNAANFAHFVGDVTSSVQA